MLIKSACVFLLGVFDRVFLRISAYCLGVSVCFCVLLQAAVLSKPRHIARNVMEGGYTERNVKPEIDLTDPQGKLKKRFHGRYIHSLKIGANPSY